VAIAIHCKLRPPDVALIVLAVIIYDLTQLNPPRTRNAPLFQHTPNFGSTRGGPYRSALPISFYKLRYSVTTATAAVGNRPDFSRDDRNVRANLVIHQLRSSPMLFTGAPLGASYMGVKKHSR